MEKTRVSLKIVKIEFALISSWDHRRQASQLGIRDRMPGASFAGLSGSTRDFGTIYPNIKIDSDSNALEFRRVLNSNLRYRVSIEVTTPWQAYFVLGKFDFGLGKLDFGLGNPILDWQPNLGLATQSWTIIPLIRIYQFKFVVSIITLNYTF